MAGVGQFMASLFALVRSLAIAVRYTEIAVQSLTTAALGTAILALATLILADQALKENVGLCSLETKHAPVPNLVHVAATMDTVEALWTIADLRAATRVPARMT
ncbi:hypothetical protein VE04_09242 [Pseudogymnoascus sp. 24MN13]|nr:hypothetical protein VE04_09242 [Pseudogymnoascus sp. 24MN13]